VKDEAEAAGYFKLAADQNDASSQNRHAICLVTGRGVVNGEAEDAEHYELAADQNHVSAQFTYTLCLANGKVVATHEAESARYFKLAADQNHASNQDQRRDDYRVGVRTGHANGATIDVGEIRISGGSVTASGLTSSYLIT
jgi:TPR repeat protein